MKTGRVVENAERAASRGVLATTMPTKILLSLALLMISLCGVHRAQQVDTAGLRFEVRVARSAPPSIQAGRLLVVISRKSDPEPRLTIGATGLDAPVVMGRDLAEREAGAAAVIDSGSIIFPLARLGDLPVGDYHVQALYDTNRDVRSPNAPGNLYSDVRQVHLDSSRGGAIKLELVHRIPPEQLPAESEFIKYIKIQSRLLSDFHGRPIHLRAGVILPRSFSDDAARRFPLRVHIGGYGASYREAAEMMEPGAAFRRAWEEPGAPQMILLHLDGDGPFGDSYQINSDVNGPYGDAVTQELIPHVERKFRALGRAEARVVDGGSTGGWVSLALQIFYPEYFNGAWASCPDSVDFRAFQLLNIYADTNAYVNARGFERPSARETNGDVRFTMRHECQMENVMGAGDSWTMSGEQWGAWNAVYGPRGADGRPVPLWHPRTGAINRDVAERWRRYDLRNVLERDWPTLAPKLRGKLRISIGEADNYFLNNAVRMLDDFLGRASPSYAGRIQYGPGQGHCWSPLTERQVMDEMEKAVSGER
ncbi:MAG: alpha/beta hydrolase-fold protein [Pyrinomonadaceae bacterium]